MAFASRTRKGDIGDRSHARVFSVTIQCNMEKSVNYFFCDDHTVSKCLVVCLETNETASYDRREYQDAMCARNHTTAVTAYETNGQGFPLCSEYASYDGEIGLFGHSFRKVPNKSFPWLYGVHVCSSVKVGRLECIVR